MTFRIFDDMTQCSDDNVARMLPLVSPQRREQALRYKFTAGRFACLKSYLMLRDILLDLHAIAEDESLIFDYGEHGKPFLHAHPDIHFSISHCPNAIAVAVHDHPIGIDIERFHIPNDALLQRTMSPAERQLITSSNNPAETFTTLWTQKEAILKCRGTGIIDDLQWVLRGSGPTFSTQINTEKQYVLSITGDGSLID